MVQSASDPATSVAAKRLAWIPRAVLAILLGGSVFAWTSAERLRDAGTFRLVFELSSSSAGVVQVFFDTGQGFNEPESATAPVAASSTPSTVALPLAAGRYRALRIDPVNGPGTFRLTNLRVENGAGRIVHQLATDTLQPLAGMQVAERTTESIAVVAPETITDPQLVLTPREPLSVTLQGADAIVLAGWLLLYCGIGMIVVALLDAVLLRLPAPGATIGSWAQQQPHATVVIAAMIGTVAATYPLLLGRSLVAPANGPVVMLYDRAPFAPGADDEVIENTRGTDVGSMMWGILPYSKVQRLALAAGEWPLWDRYNGLGRPLWGQGQSMFLDPLHLASLLVEDPSTGWDLKFFYARALFATGVGLAAFAATGSLAAAATIAIAAPFFGFFTFRLNHPASFSLTYVPWLLWASFMLARQTTRPGVVRWSVALAIATALQIVAATPKEGAIALLGSHATGAVAVLVAAGSWRLRSSRLAALIAGAACGVLLAAPHWLIFLHTLSRAWTVYDVPSARFATAQTIASLALGPATPGTLGPGTNTLIAIGVLLALVAPGGIWRRAPVAAVGIVSAALLGVASGVVPDGLLLRLPLIRNLYHVDYAFIGAALVPLAIVAAAGLSSIASAFSRPRRAVVFFVITAVAGFLLIDAIGGVAVLGRMATYPAVLAITAAALFPWVMWSVRKRSPTRLGALTATMLAASILLPGGLHLDTGNGAIDAVLMQPRPRADLDEPSPATRAAQSITTDPFRAAGIDTTLFAGTQVLYGFEGLIGADAVELPELRELGRAAGMFTHPWIWLSLLDEADLEPMRGVLDMFGVRVLFAPPEAQIPVGRALRLDRPDLVQAIERPTAWPRAFFVDGVASYDTPADLVNTLRNVNGPFAAIQSTDPDASTLRQRFGRHATTVVPAFGYRLTPNTTTFRVTTTSAGVAVLGEAYVAGDFRARLNGEPAQYFRVNHLYKGIVIPGRGEWEIVFEFRPALWGIAWALTGVALALLGAGLLSARSATLL